MYLFIFLFIYFFIHSFIHSSILQQFPLHHKIREMCLFRPVCMTCFGRYFRLTPKAQDCSSGLGMSQSPCSVVITNPSQVNPKMMSPGFVSSECDQETRLICIELTVPKEEKVLQLKLVTRFQKVLYSDQYDSLYICFHQNTLD